MSSYGGRNSASRLPLDSRLQHQLLLEFSACQPVPQLLNLAPASCSQFLKISLLISLSLCLSLFFYVCVCVCMPSHFTNVQCCVILWTVARQAPLSMGFSRQEHWSGLPCLPPRDLPDPGIESRSPALQADSLPAELPGKPFSMCVYIYVCVCIHIYVCTYVCVPSHFSCVQLFATPRTLAHQAPLSMSMWTHLHLIKFLSMGLRLCGGRNRSPVCPCAVHSTNLGLW